MSFSFWNVMASTVSSSPRPPPNNKPRSRRQDAPGAGAGWAALRLGGTVLLLSVLARVALDATGGVDQLLLAREERVAARADLQPHLAGLGGLGGPRGAAGAVDVH